MVAMIAVFVALLVLGMPIAFALGSAGVVGLWWMHIDLTVVAERAFTGIDSFVLLAVPFFILAGEIMSRGGITERLVRLANMATSKARAGTAYAAIVSEFPVQRSPTRQHLAMYSFAKCPRRGTARTIRPR